MLFDRELNNSHSGNISQRSRGSIFITATGSMLSKVNPRQVIRVGLTVDSIRDQRASMELVVHRAIYNAHPHVNAIIHAHCPYSVAMAEGRTTIVPHDDEGKYYFSSIPILNLENSIGSIDVANQIPFLFKDSPVAILNRHGVFAVGKSLEEALKNITVVESVCKINYLLETRHAA